MGTIRVVALASLLTAGFGIAAAPASAQTATGPSSGEQSTTQIPPAPMPGAAPNTQDSSGTTGTVPGDTLMQERQGAILGKPSVQGGGEGSGGTGQGTTTYQGTGDSGGTGTSAAPTGQLPEGTLPQERQGAITGAPVQQGGGQTPTTSPPGAPPQR